MSNDKTVQGQEQPWQTEEREKKAIIAMSSDEFDQMMCRKFPSIFADRNKPMNETCMCWGFDVGPGWYPILLDLCTKIDVLCRLSGCQVVADQVKEKYATLRFYFHTLPPQDTPEDKIYPDDACIIDDIVQDVVNQAESKTGMTCEKCGEYGERRVFGCYHVTLCHAHTDEMAVDRGQPFVGSTQKDKETEKPEVPASEPDAI